MQFIRFPGAALAALVLVASPAQAASSPMLTPVDAVRAEALCPLPGGQGVLSGKLGQELTGSDYAGLNELHASFAPFTSADLDRTDWSQRLTAVNYRAALQEGQDPQAWREALEESLLANGWEPFNDKTLASVDAMSESQFKKLIGSGEDTRLMVIEVDTPGALLLRCGDHDLLRRNLGEQAGRLAPGTPRPARKPGEPVPVPPSSVCEKPEWREAFAKVTEPRQIGPATLRNLPDHFEPSNLASDAERLNRWLRWKMLGSGKVDRETIWKVEETVVPGDEATIADMEQSIGAMSEVFAANKEGDPLRTCQAMLAMLAGMNASDAREAARWGQINAALEAEAIKRGIALD